MPATNALEAVCEPRKVRAARVTHHQDNAPLPLVVLNPLDPLDVVLAIRAEVKRIRRCGAGSYVFISPAMDVFVVSELRSVAGTWVKTHFGWLVAFYAPKTKAGDKYFNGLPFMAATVNGIAEDVECHLCDLRRLQSNVPAGS